MNNPFLQIETADFSDVNKVLSALAVSLLGGMIYLYKEKQAERKDFETKIDKIIDDTTKDFKKIIDDGIKDKIDMRILMEKTYDALAEIKRLMHEKNGR